MTPSKQPFWRTDIRLIAAEERPRHRFFVVLTAPNGCDRAAFPFTGRETAEAFFQNAPPCEKAAMYERASEGWALVKLYTSD